MLQRLIYFSERDRSCVDVKDLVSRSAELNRRRNITGLLVADDRCFVQMLEGHRNSVSSLFQTISRDTRHRNIVLVEVSEIEEYAAPDWGMHRLDDAGQIQSAWGRISDKDRTFDPWSMDAEEIKDFLAIVQYDLTMAREKLALSAR